MIYEDLASAALALKKGAYFNISALTEPKMLKTDNPFIGRVKKFSYYISVRAGVSYENCVNNALLRNDAPANYLTESPKGMQWLQYPYILQSLKDSAQHYLRISQDKSSSVGVCYLLDGRIATVAEIAEISKFFPANKPCEKQEKAGLTAEEQIRPLSIKTQNVVRLVQGEIEYRNEPLLEALQAAQVALAQR